MTRFNKKCTKYAKKGGKLCTTHLAAAAGQIQAKWTPEARERFREGIESGGPTPAQSVRSGLDTGLKKTAKRLGATGVTTGSTGSTGPDDDDGLPQVINLDKVAATARGDLTKFTLNENAKSALKRLGLEATDGFDPKRALLHAVESSWRQARVWEAMLASIPESDYEFLGEMPIPGLKSTARGARIDLIQRHLSESTKNAAKISAMAVTAGIEERMVRLAEEQSALIADTVRAGLIAAISSLRLSPKAEAAALEAALQSASGRLRMLAAGLSNEAADDPTILEGIAREVRKE